MPTAHAPLPNGVPENRPEPDNGNNAENGGRSAVSGRWAQVSADSGRELRYGGAPRNGGASRAKAQPRFSGLQVALSAGAGLVIGALVTSLGFIIIGGDDKEANNAARASSTDVPHIPSSGGGSSASEDRSSESIKIGDGYTATTMTGAKAEVTVTDFSVDQPCKYGQSSYARKGSDTRIVQLTLDVKSLGGGNYGVDDPETVSAAGYTQPVEEAMRWCEDPTDGAGAWWQNSYVDSGDRKILYAAYEIQPDATQLVLVSDRSGKITLDIPAAPSGREPEPTA